MKKFLPTFVFLLFAQYVAKTQVCNPSGNYMIFSNYDGGHLVIDVDVNIPNLRIGIVSYEAVDVTITGTYAGNVTAVDYSGYNNSPNNHCSPSIATTTITGFASPTINTIPPATLSDPGGYPYIICAYNCGGSTGGCNTTVQVEHYYQTMFGGNLYAHYTQYGCWGGVTHQVSAGGTCCLTPAAAPVADFSVSSDTICAGECIAITDMSTNAPNAWSWVLSGASPGSSSTQHPTACYNTPGSYNITLTATNAVGSDVVTKSVLVQGVNTTVNVSGPSMTSAATGATYQWIDCSTSSPVPGASDSVYTATANGMYAVIVTQNGCTDTSSCINITTVGLEDRALAAGDLEIYPNPARDLVVIEDRYGLLGHAQLTMLNAVGEQVYTTVLQSPRHEIQLRGIPAGIYLVSVKSNAGVLVKKLVLE